MKIFNGYLLVVCVGLFCMTNINADPLTKVSQKKWIHGAKNCSTDNGPAIDILKLNENSYILRQNKCTHYEAPFIYVLFGNQSVFVQDTGATEDSASFPLFDVIQQLVSDYQTKHSLKQLKVIVSHSHSHSDHYAGDPQFEGRTNFTLIKPNSKAVRDYFGFNQWPNGQAVLQLGGRELIILPLPGHQADALAVYDTQTQILLTGDSFYPGRLYIRDWKQFKQSIQRLVDFTQKQPVKGLLGTHIEMANDGHDYPVSTIYQPNEASLVLSVEDLQALNQRLISLVDTPTRSQVGNVIIYPVK